MLVDLFLVWPFNKSRRYALLLGTYMYGLARFIRTFPHSLNFLNKEREYCRVGVIQIILNGLVPSTPEKKCQILSCLDSRERACLFLARGTCPSIALPPDRCHSRAIWIAHSLFFSHWATDFVEQHPHRQNRTLNLLIVRRRIDH